MQAAENLLAAVSDFTAGAEDLQPGDVIAWALAHAVAALAYELGAPRAFPAAAPGGPAVARPNPAPAAS